MIDLAALCILEEAGGESDDGKAAVARVIKNRMERKYESDGTLAGTILKWDQFSWAWFDYVRGSYRRVAWNEAQALQIAQQKYIQASTVALLHCSDIYGRVMDGLYNSPEYAQLTDDTVLYLNESLVHLPPWAIPSKHVAKIGSQDFFRA